MNEVRKLKQWIDGGWSPTLADDTRDLESPIYSEDYEKWMFSCGFHVVQLFGSEHGYGYYLYRNNRHLGAEAHWIISIFDQSDCEDVVVEGYTNLASLLSHLAPGAISSVVSEGAMGYLEDMAHEKNRGRST